MSKVSTATTADRVLEDLVIAILAVNSYSLDKVFKLRDGLRSAGWYDPKAVSTLKHDQAVANLVKAGYDRGPTMNSIFASRLQDLGQYLVKEGLDPIVAAVSTRNREKVDQILGKLHGVGPVVIKNFWALQDEA